MEIFELFKKQDTERNFTVVRFLTRIREMLCSNLCRGISYPEIFCGFTEFFQANARILLRSGHDIFLPNPFQFINHHTIRRYDLAIQKVVK
jgi:hypothetical protein